MFHHAPLYLSPGQNRKHFCGKVSMFPCLFTSFLWRHKLTKFLLRKQRLVASFPGCFKMFPVQREKHRFPT